MTNKQYIDDKIKILEHKLDLSMQTVKCYMILTDIQEQIIFNEKPKYDNIYNMLKLHKEQIEILYDIGVK